MAEVQADVRRAYFAQFVAEQRQALLQEMQALAQRARDAAQARFDAGGVPRLEVVQAQLALADAQNQAAAARGTVTAARATLNAAVGLPLEAPTTVDASLAPAPPRRPSIAVSTSSARECRWPRRCVPPISHPRPRSRAGPLRSSTPAGARRWR